MGHVVILVREIGVTLLRFAVIRYGVIAASPGGKAKTLVQIIAIGLYIMPLPDAFYWLLVGAMGLAVLLTVARGSTTCSRPALYTRAIRPLDRPPAAGA